MEYKYLFVLINGAEFYTNDFTKQIDEISDFGKVETFWLSEILFNQKIYRGCELRSKDVISIIAVK